MVENDTEHKYRNDPYFHAMVESIFRSVIGDHITPGDVKEAVELGLLMVEEWHEKEED